MKLALGNLAADTSEGQYAMACITDDSGALYWVRSEEIVVESIDGVAPHRVLSDLHGES